MSVIKENKWRRRLQRYNKCKIDPRTEKITLSEKVGEIQIRSVDQLIVLHQHKFSTFNHCIMVIEDAIILGEAE